VTEDNELSRMWQEVAVAHFRFIPRRLIGRNVENHDIP